MRRVSILSILFVFVLMALCAGNNSAKAQPKPEDLATALTKGEWKVVTDFPKEKGVQGVFVVRSVSNKGIVDAYVQYGKDGNKQPLAGVLDTAKDSLKLTFYKDGKPTEASAEITFTRKAGKVVGGDGKWQQAEKGVEFNMELKRTK